MAPPRIVPFLRRLSQRAQAAWSEPEKRAYLTGRRQPADLTLPRFLGIGAQKAGSSWLYENLRRHPELFLPEQKELHYFDRRCHRPLRFYASKFREAGGRVCGEVTPAYSTLPLERIRLIRAVMPEAGLLLLLRDPISRAWSHALMHLVDHPGRRYEDVSEAEFLAHFRGEDSRGKGDYGAILDRWLAEFPGEQLFIGYFEEIDRSPQALLERVLAHLGVSRDVDWSRFPLTEPVNRGPRLPLPERYRAALEELYAPEIERLYQRLGEPVVGWRVPR